MNIVIIGGGDNFGKYAADRFRNEGHRVKILSHKNYGVIKDHLWANFNDVKDVIKNFNDLIEDIDHIDLLLYSSNVDRGPAAKEEFTSNAPLMAIERAWLDTLYVNTVVPHIISVLSLKKMTENSKIVFMTSGISLDISRDYCLTSAGHPGTKAAQNHLMYVLSLNNDKNVLVYSVSPHFPMENKEELEKIRNKVFENLKTFDRTLNSKIVNFWS